MSAISLKSITGITSITTPAGVDNQLTLHTNDTTQRVKVTQSGIEVVGVATFQDIDVDGHTNLDNVSVAGVTTFAGNIELTGALNTDTARIRLPDGMNGGPFTGNLELGNSRDFVMLHDGHHNYVKSTQNMYVFCGGNNLITLQTGGSVLLNRDLDVDGHTNLDNVSIAGVSTFTGNIKQTAPGTNTAKITLNNASDTTGMDVGYSESSGVGFINVGQSGSGLSIKTGGTAAGNERLRITSDGIVNIGGNFTQNSYKLSVYTASGASIIAKSASSTHPTANIWCHNDTANWLALGVWGSAATTSGLITANDALVGANNDLCLYSTNASGNVKFGAGSGYPELMRLTSSGNLNITGDLTQTSYVLSVTNSSNTNLLRLKTANEGDYDLRFNIQNNESHMWHYGTDDFVIGNRYDRKLHFITNGSKRLTIHGSYIGINQTAPQTGLHINQDWVNSYGSVSVEGSANVLVGFGLRSNGNYRGSLIWRDGTSGNYMDLSTYGNDAYDILFRQNGNERSRVTTHGLKITNAQSGNLGAALRINTDYTNYGTIIVRDKNETYTSCLQCENENSGASTENRVYRSVNRSSADWAGANLEARFHNFRIQGSTSSHDKFTITNNGVRSNGAVSGTVCNSFRANTSYTSYGVFTARDASSANEHNACFQAENPNTGTDTTNQFMRSVDASSNSWANAKYSAKSHRFHTSGSSASSIVMNITDDGHAVHFGNQTNLAKYNSNVAGASWYDDKDSFQQGNRASIGWAHYYMNKIGSGDDRFFQFASDGSVTGYITRSGSNTQFQTSSDYRLKKDVVALPNGIDRVKQLRPVAFKWISDNTDMEGFLAHEAQEICPYAVSGKKDEVATEDHGDRKKGDMIVQAVDYGEFTPLLTAAMKELIAKVETLEAEIAALKGS